MFYKTLHKKLPDVKNSQNIKLASATEASWLKKLRREFFMPSEPLERWWYFCRSVLGNNFVFSISPENIRNHETEIIFPKYSDKN